MKQQRGITLIELIATIVVMAVIGAATLPIISGAVDAYGAADDSRRRTEEIAYAMERMLRVLREIPEGDEEGEVGIDTADPADIELADGTRFELDGEDLEFTDPDGVTAVLLRGVDELEFEYLDDDGTTDTSATPGNTQRINVVLEAQGIELRSCVFIRIRMTQ